MKIGGRAYKNGVALFGENYSVKAYYQQEQLIYEVGKNDLADNKLYQFSRKIPLLRGIINLIFSIFFLLKEVTARPKRFWPFLLLIGLDIGLEIYLILFPAHSSQVINNIFIFSPIVYWLCLASLAVLLRQTLFKQIFKFHGAEHKAVNYYQSEFAETIKSHSRLARRCGTNLVVIYLLLIVVVEYFGLGFNIWLEMLALLGVAYELLLLMPDFLLTIPFTVQRFTTIEPDQKQLRAAKTAIDVLISKEKQHG